MTEPRGTEVFTDGSFNPVAKSGGWAFVVYHGGHEVHLEHGSAPVLSNNATELLAVVNAARWANTQSAGMAVTIWTDSRHVLEGCGRWRLIWRNNGWKRIDPNPRTRKRPIPDAHLWQVLDAELAGNDRLSVAWCKGHMGLPGNEKAHALAKARCL